MVATAEQIEQSRQLIEQQEAARAKAVAAAIALAVASTQRFDGWYSTAAITAWALRLALSIESIQRNLARQTDVYLAREASLITGRTVRPVGAVEVSTLRRGITHAGAYGRVADTYRYQQSRIDAGEKNLVPAIEAAVSRAEAIVDMDTQLAVRAQTQKFLTAQPRAAIAPAPPRPLARTAPEIVTPLRPAITEPSPEPTILAEPDEPSPEEQAAEQAAAGPAPARPRLIGYRRIVHPELPARPGLAPGPVCGMCLVASTRMYFVDELMPIHANCRCEQFPVYEGLDPGGFINLEDLDKFYREAGGKQATELKKTRYQVNEHGELGPVLDRYGAPFRSPEDIRRDAR